MRSRLVLAFLACLVTGSAVYQRLARHASPHAAATPLLVDAPSDFDLNERKNVISELKKQDSRPSSRKGKALANEAQVENIKYDPKTWTYEERAYYHYCIEDGGAPENCYPRYEDEVSSGKNRKNTVKRSNKAGSSHGKRNARRNWDPKTWTDVERALYRSCIEDGGAPENCYPQ